MDMTHPLAYHYDRVSFIATAFFMTYTCSLDYEIYATPEYRRNTLCATKRHNIKG